MTEIPQDWLRQKGTPEKFERARLERSAAAFNVPLEKVAQKFASRPFGTLTDAWRSFIGRMLDALGPRCLSAIVSVYAPSSRSNSDSIGNTVLAVVFVWAANYRNRSEICTRCAELRVALSGADTNAVPHISQQF